MPANTAKSTWQEALSDLITDPMELIKLLELDPNLLGGAEHAARAFALKVPRRFLARIEKGNPNDPLLKQILPLDAELKVFAGYEIDPLQEAKVNPVPGLLHKYSGRVLVTLTSACAVHCRYCFRRSFPYEENNPGRIGWEKIFSYIRNDTTISEVILSGGDPLAVSDKLLKLFSNELQTISHVKRLRLHTRVPVVLPERMTKEFIEWITQVKVSVVMVIHANHAREINHEVADAMQLLRNAGIVILNQSVLLKGVNDDTETLAELSEALFAAGVVPYYLHRLDKVAGAEHFDLPEGRAEELHRSLTNSLPGYLVPRLVCEEPGQPSKTLLSTALFTG